MRHEIACIFVGIGVGMAILASLGVAVMRAALDRLHFSAVVASFSVGLIALAVWIDEPDWQARLKVLLVALILFATNSILSHSTARAIRIHDDKHFEPRPEEQIARITP